MEYESIEREIVKGAVVSTEFLKKSAQVYKKGFLSDEADIVFKWCLDHLAKKDKAPNKSIKLIFQEKTKFLNSDQSDIISGVLDSLSDEWEEESDDYDFDYLFEKTVEYFQNRAFSILAEELRVANENSDINRSVSLLESFRKPEFTPVTYDDFFENEELEKEAFEEEQVPLFKFPGALGKMINGQLTKGSFIGLMGPEKRGKTWWLMEFGMKAAQYDQPTVIFQAGDMNRRQMKMRVSIRLAKKSNRKAYCGDLFLPVLDCTHNQDDSCSLKCRMGYCGLAQPKPKKEDEEGGQRKKAKKETDFSPEQLLFKNPNYVPCTECYRDNPLKFHGAVFYKKREKCSPLSLQEALTNGAKYKKKWRNSPRMLTYPAKSLSVQDIRNVLDEFKKNDGFEPTVIIIDYADILKSSNPKHEERHRQNEIWTDLRALSIERDCLVVTATQADAASQEKATLSTSNFSEDKRKYGHVTAMWGLNQTDEDRMRGIMRLNLLLARNDSFNSSRCVSVLQSLETGQPLISSFLTRR